jgi:hypothetical protein
VRAAFKAVKNIFNVITEAAKTITKRQLEADPAVKAAWKLVKAYKEALRVALLKVTETTAGEIKGPKDAMG